MSEGQRPYSIFFLMCLHNWGRNTQKSRTIHSDSIILHENRNLNPK